MTNKKAKKIVSDMKKTTNKAAVSRTKSIKLLKKAGICTSSGKLTKVYR